MNEKYFTYSQLSGTFRLLDDSVTGIVYGKGYSGFGVGKNKPLFEHHKDLGPLPSGWYTMHVVTDASGKAIDYEGKANPVIVLTPDKENQMFGRSGFLIHGDSRKEPGTASKGCVIEDHGCRILIADAIMNEKINRLYVTR